MSEVEFKRDEYTRREFRGGEVAMQMKETTASHTGPEKVHRRPHSRMLEHMKHRKRTTNEHITMSFHSGTMTAKHFAIDTFGDMKENLSAIMQMCQERQISASLSLLLFYRL